MTLLQYGDLEGNNDFIAIWGPADAKDVLSLHEIMWETFPAEPNPATWPQQSYRCDSRLPGMV